MEKQVNSIISFQGYTVENIIFKRNKEFKNKNNKICLEFDFNSNLIIDKDNKKSLVNLECEIFKNDFSENYPFYMKVEIQGRFSYQLDDQFDLVENLLKNNTLAILFPYLRSTVSIVTSNSGLPAVILPTINVVDFIKNKENNNLI